jgi:hypothetical protein
MSHKITTPPINYYDDESRYGEYQYVTLTELVNNFITNMIGDDKLLSNVKRYNVLYHMKRGISELSYDALKDVRAIELEIGDTLSVPLPIDYVSYVRVSMVGDDGTLQPLAVNNKTTIAKSYLQDHQFNILFDQDGYPLEATPSVAETRIMGASYINVPSDVAKGDYTLSASPNYNFDVSQNGNGTFVIDKRTGKMNFSSNIFSKIVIIEYISDGLEGDPEFISVHKFAEQALYDYVKYMLLNNKYGVQEYIINRAKKDYHASLQNAKIRMLELRKVNLHGILNNRKQWLK